MSAIVSALVLYQILAFLSAGVLFLAFSVVRQDFMQEELTIKLTGFNNIEDMLQNMLGEAKQSQDNIYLKMVNLTKDATYDLKAHFGLKQSVFTVTISRNGNPIQLVILKLSWIFDNDLFLNPQNYGIPQKYQLYFETMSQKRLTEQRQACICMLIAVLCVVLAIILIFLKAFKWPKHLLFASLILVIIACICTTTALTFIPSKFKFVKVFDKLQKDIRDGDLNQLGLGGIRNQNLGKLEIEIITMKESIESLHVYAVLGMGFLLLGSLGSVLEYFILKRSTDAEVRKI